MATVTSKTAAAASVQDEQPRKKGIFLKLIIMGVILFVLAGGALVVLARYQIITVPYISDLPYIKQAADENATTPELTELQKVAQENDGLNKTIKDQKVEIEALNEDLNKLKQENQSAVKKQTEYEKTIEDLQKQIVELKGGQSGQKAAYKQLAVYFSEMKSADAANIMAKLDDNDIIGILTEMTDDTAAGILGKLPVDRAAVISKKMLAISP